MKQSRRAQVLTCSCVYLRTRTFIHLPCQKDETSLLKQNANKRLLLSVMSRINIHHTVKSTEEPFTILSEFYSKNGLEYQIIQNLVSS